MMTGAIGPGLLCSRQALATVSVAGRSGEAGTT
jgi:hypothetical protein